MVGKKRGTLLVLVLALLVLGMIGSEVNALASKIPKYVALEVDVGQQDTCVSVEKSEIIDSMRTGDIGTTWNIYGCTDWAGDSYGSVSFPPQGGCMITVAEYDSNNGDDCAYAEISPGKVVIQKALGGTYLIVANGRGLPGVSSGVMGTIDVFHNDYNDALLGFDKKGYCGGAPSCSYYCPYPWMSAGNTQDLCANDHYWYECSETSNGLVAWVDNYLYNCTQDQITEYYTWVKQDTDEDLDGYTTSQGDCANNLSTDSLSCPKPLLRDLMVGLTLEEARSQVADLCIYPKDSACSICINPDAPEYCGDGIDNDCNSKTSDDCNYNQYACQLEPVPVDLGFTEQKNVLDQTFPWIKLQDGTSLCCGYNGAKDNGKVVIDQGDLAEYVCVNKNMLGATLDVSALPGVKPASGGENWYLLPANYLDLQFKVLTVKTPGIAPYDIVSDSQKWRVCNKSTDGPLNVGDNPDVESKMANHFYCYQEGDHWSWAECYGAGKQTFNDKSIKGRNPGDGSYSLFLGESTPGNEFILQDSKVTLSSEKGKYNTFYGIGTDTSPFAKAKYDFSGYDQLEFFVRFGEVGNIPLSSKLPFNVRLEIYSANTVASSDKGMLFSQPVLGYTLNNPFLGADNWMHVRVPIPNNLKGVSHLVFTSDPESSGMQIKNVYLSKADQIQPVCSGADSAIKNSWLTSFDDGSTDSNVNGEQMCIKHYGPNAWLGNQEEVLGENAASSYCCGNDAYEYYSSSSKTGYGCWNSMPIAPGNTTMNVEFSLTYNQPTEEIAYPNISVTYNLQALYQYGSEDGSNIDQSEAFSATQKISYGISLVEMPIWPKYKKYDNVFYKLTKSTVSSNTKGVSFYFFDMNDGTITPDEISNSPDYDTRNLLLLAEWRKITPSLSSEERTEDFNYPCNQETCYFPVKGEPPYYITNPYPNLYELYFLEKDQEPQLIIETNQEFTSLGMLMAKKVAQQVVYINTEAATAEITSPDVPAPLPESVQTDQGFYGCQAADFLTEISPENNLPYCSIKANLFCSPSVPHKEKNEKYTTINSWSPDSLNELGYEEPQSGAQSLTDFALGLNLVTLPILTLPAQRNYSAPLLPGRNILSNALFLPSGKEVPHWIVLNSDNNDANFLEEIPDGEHKFVLGEAILQSERISVPGETDLYLSYNGSATSTIYSINRNGERLEVFDNPFQVENSSYVIIEFNGGDVYHPSLQALDAQGKNSYTYNGKYLDRGGAACCPTDSCWNGYMCVRDMTPYTSLFEPVNLAKNYRCIKGEWKFLPPKMDWTGDPEHWGYCEKNDQCFVLASSLGGIKTNTALDFYLGKYPTCINSGEYIFDHYCDNGNWTSRTKFLAEKLVEAGSNDDYTLYCSNYKNTLPEYEDKEPFLGGRVSQQVASANEDLLAINEAQAVSSCFDKIMDGEGKRLVQDNGKHHENTCVNNVCILKYTEGGASKIAFATSLNQPINGSDSFLQALEVPLSQVETVCPSSPSQSGFVLCTVPDLEGDLWYSSQLNSIIYAKDGLQISPGLFKKITEWVKSLFGLESELSSEQKFVEQAQNYREVYLSTKGEKKVRSLQEYFSEEKQMLVAEYDNYDTPVCSYLFNLKAPAELEVELFKQVSGEGKLTCSENGTTQRVEAIAGLDFLWPQLTAKLRPE